MRWKDRRPLLLLLALTALFYWKVVFSDRFTFLDSPDLTGQVLPWYDVQARAWHAGEFPLWDPYVWGGQPLLGQMQPGGAFPLNWPVFLAPLDDGRVSLRALHLQFGLMHVLAALFAYVLARELGRSRSAAVVAGLLYACGGYIASISWPQMLNGAVWLPLTLFCLHRAERIGWRVRGAAWAVLCGGSAGLSALSGHHQTPYFSALAVGGVAIWLGWRRARASPRAAVSWAGLLAVVGAVAFLVGALQLLPAFEYGRTAYRWVDAPRPVGYDDPVPYSVHEAQRLYPVTLLGLVLPDAHYQVSTFVGWTGLALALGALLTRIREPAAALYAGLGVGGLLFAIGPFSVLHGWIYNFLPLADKARSPAHAVFILHLALAILAARGADWLVESHPQVWPRALQRLPAALAAFAGLTWIFIYSKIPDRRLDAEPGDQMAMAALAALAVAAVWAATRRGALKPRQLRWILPTLLLFELYTGQRQEFSDQDDPSRQRFFGRYEQYAEAMDFLERQPRPFRFEVIPDGGSVNLGARRGLEQIDGFLASVSGNLHDFFDQAGWVEGRLAFNTVYTVARERQRDTQQEVFQGSNGWKVFHNPDARPRAWIEPAGDCPEPSGAEVFRDELVNSVQLTASAPCGGKLVVGNPWAPGWTARVDGRRRPVDAYRGALQAVELTPGESQIRLQYRPASVRWGAWLTAAGFALCAVAGVMVGRRPREAGRRPPPPAS